MSGSSEPSVLSVPEDIFDQYPDVQYYGIFLSKNHVSMLKDEIPLEILASHRYSVFNPHLTLSHRNNRGNNEIQKYVNDHFEQGVDLTVTKLHVTENLVAAMLDSSTTPNSVSVGAPHISLYKHHKYTDMKNTGEECAASPTRIIHLSKPIVLRGCILNGYQYGNC